MSVLTTFKKVISPADNQCLRDIEPLVGGFLCSAHPQKDSDTLRRYMRDTQRKDCNMLRRGGYLIELLCYYGPHQNDWGRVLMWAGSGWLVPIYQQLPPDCPLMPFYPADKRNTEHDQIAQRWMLSSGVLYDRMKRLTDEPYVC